MSNPIQIPYLRDLPIHEGAGLQQAGGEDQLGQLAKLLMLKGQLALEQEKFQSEEQERKQKKQTLGSLSQGLSQIFSQPGVMDSPQGLSGAFQQAIPQLAGAGMGPEAASLAGKLPGLQEPARTNAVTSATGALFKEFQAQDVSSPTVQGEFLMHLGQIAGPEAMAKATEALKPLMRDVSYHYVPNVGLFAGDKQGNGRIVVNAEANDPAAKERQANAAMLALQRISNLEHILKADPNANVEPPQAAGAENLAQSGTAKAIIGGLGAMGIGAGTPQAIATTKRSDGQVNFRRDMQGFAHAYFIWLGGSPRSYILYQNILDSFYPGAEAPPAARAAAWQELQSVKPLMLASMRGQKVDFTKLPFFNDIQMAEAKAGGAGQMPTPPMPPEAPLGPEDLLRP